MKISNAKGTKDRIGEEAILAEYVKIKLTDIFRRYGFNPLETPMIEKFETLSSKYAGGAEILKETFKLKDQGNRELGLRYDLTVPLARVVAMNPNLKMPFKRYQISDVFRDGPIKLGRYREFTQCDVDMIGVDGMKGEAELLSLANDFFKELKLKTKIVVNNRKILDGIMDKVDVNNKDKSNVILILDKLTKFGEEQVKKELKEYLDNKEINELLGIIKIKKIELLKEKLRDNKGLDELEELLRLLNYYNVKVEVDFSLARGLSYYTGTIFEVYLENSEVKSSVAAGGRYDNMIGNFLENKKKVSAVGISFGLNVIMDGWGDKKGIKSVTKVFVIPIKQDKEGIKVVNRLRKEGINSEVDLIGKGISKNLDYVDKMGINYAIFVGDKEVKSGKYKLKDMKSGKESLMKIESIIKKIKI